MIAKFSAAVLLALLISPAGAAIPKPNFIIIFTDDQGWGDLGVYGSPDIRTPNLDRLAQEGAKFTSFYAAPFCGPSRAALMTGCYPPRISLAFNHGPKETTGIHPDELTLPEMLKTRGYATKIIGKWHLGDHSDFLPTSHGFDSYYGIPYSNDMWPFHPLMPVTQQEHPRMTAARRRAAETGFAGEGGFYSPDGGFPQPLPLMEDVEVVEFNPDQTKLTTTYTEKAVEFITANKDQPFFLYLPHSMPHVPLFVSAARAGKSKRGLYGDVIEEIDWSTGRILETLEELGIDDQTLVVFTSDNGPWLQYGMDAGSAGPLRDGKATHWEGGMRVPGLMRWPGQIPAGLVTSEIAANMDLLPTIARLAGAKLPGRVIDGRDIWPLMSEPAASSPHDYFYYFSGSRPGEPPRLRAIRDAAWKLHLDVKYQWSLDPEKNEFRGTELYDLGQDVGEQHNVIVRQPDVVRRLENAAREFYISLARNVRPLGRIGAPAN